MRMSKESRTHLLAADRAEYFPTSGGFYVKLYVGNCSGFICGANTEVLYKTKQAALRAVRRFRDDLPVTEYVSAESVMHRAPTAKLDAIKDHIYRVEVLHDKWKLLASAITDANEHGDTVTLEQCQKCEEAYSIWKEAQSQCYYTVRSIVRFGSGV